MRTIFVSGASLLGAIFLFGLNGCGGSEPETANESTPTSAAQPSQPSTSAESPPAAPPSSQAGPASSDLTPAGQLLNDIELPDDYPSDAPIYPGSKPSQAPPARLGRVGVIFRSYDDPAQIQQYMDQELPRLGWQVVISDDLPNGILVQGMKGDRLMSIVVSIFDKGQPSEVTMIALTTDPEES